MNELSRPLFIIGNPRSGTSLFRLLLTSHSRVIIPPECGFIAWLYKDFGQWKSKDIGAGLDKFLNALNACKKFDTWEINLADLKVFLNNHNPTNYAELCTYVYLFYGARFSKSLSIWGDKNNFHIDHLNELLDIFPKARFIHLVRDGRDVYCSYLEVMRQVNKSPYAPSLSTDLKAVASEWGKNVNTVDEFFKGNDKAKTVRYEDLITSPTDVLTDVLSWCGLEFESSMLEFFKQNIAMNLEPEKTMEWKAKTKEPIIANNSGKYLSVMSRDNIEQFNEIAGGLLYKYGYM